MNRLLMRTAVVGPLVCLAILLLGEAASASDVLMKDGRILKGKLGEVFGLADMPVIVDSDGGKVKQIVFLDDDLRRTFISRWQIAEVKPDSAGQLEEDFNIRQRALRSGAMIKSVGPIVKVQPFDDFGRRIFTMNTNKGPVDVIQGITEITPQWTKVEGINYMWDMRMATSAIPRDVLHKILMKQIDPKNIEQRKKVARFYLQSERYDEAREALEEILKAFPEKTELKQELAPSIRSLRQLAAQKLLSELKLRRNAGQHALVEQMLKKFPSEDVPGEILQAVREIIQEYEGLQARRAKVVKDFQAILEGVKDPALQKQLKPIAQELESDLSYDTLPRMAAFLQNADDAQMPAEERLSLAVSGWLLGTDAATPRLSMALAAWNGRDVARRYFGETIKLNRAKLFRALPTELLNSPDVVANLVSLMEPPLEMPEPVSPKTPGYFKLEAPGMTGEPSVTYHLQLPPEYNPYRRYPMIISLHGGGSSAEQQIDWWAGAWTGTQRGGQAARQGYIVLAPEWASPDQRLYGYTAREHAIVLSSLRDACRRFAVDTDRVFLSGHSMGGDAAWDIGLAHPDLWAGVIPIVAESQKFCTFYWENARYVPFYVVLGELDNAKLSKNARDLDRYMKRGFNTTVVEYLGRGHEHFYDEMLRLFDWMGRFRRDFYPRKFDCVTMRPWDNFFWWLETDGLPPGAMVNPASWPPARGAQAVHLQGSILANNNISVRTNALKISVWLSPQMVDFKSRVAVVVNGRKIGGQDPIRPNLETILEDVRTRGDRQHPFWARIDAPTGRSGGEP